MIPSFPPFWTYVHPTSYPSPRLRAARVVDHLGHSQAAPSGDSAVAVAERALAAACDQIHHMEIWEPLGLPSGYLT